MEKIHSLNRIAERDARHRIVNLSILFFERAIGSTKLRHEELHALFIYSVLLVAFKRLVVKASFVRGVGQRAQVVDLANERHQLLVR